MRHNNNLFVRTFSRRAKVSDLTSSFAPGSWASACSASRERTDIRLFGAKDGAKNILRLNASKMRS